MKVARKNIQQRQEGVPQKGVANKGAEEASVNRELKEMLDPMTQKLFAMLPPPKESGGTQSLSSAIRNADTKVQLIDTKPTPSFLEQDDEEEEESQVQGMVEISEDRLRNKEDFYRAQLKRHSLQQFRDQTLSRMKQFDQADILAKKGKSKNHLVSLASDQLDLMTQIQDSKSNNLDEFRQKRARYGW